MKRNQLFAFTTSLILSIGLLVGCNSGTGHTHNFVKVNEVPATCTTDGVKTYYTCDGCDKIFDEDKNETSLDALKISSKGHTLVKTSATAPTCSNDGNSEYYTCSSCGKHFADKDGNNEIAENSWGIPALEHEIIKHEATEPTCSTDGNSVYYECQNCGKYFSDENCEHEIENNSWVIEAHGHTLSKTDGTPATCTEGGSSEYYTCSTCGKYFSDAAGNNEIEENSWVLAPLGHNMTKHDAIEATCTEGGNSEYYSCSNCGKYFLDEDGSQEINVDSWNISPKGHSIVHVDAKDPSFTEKGMKEHWKCSACGKLFVDNQGEQEVSAKALEIPKINGYVDFEDNDPNGFVTTDSRDQCSVSEDYAHSGTKSMKAVIEAGHKLLVLSDEYYDNLPDEGVSFSIFSTSAFNCDIAGGGRIKYYKQNCWLSYTIEKSKINPDAGDHWIFTLTAAGTMYVDDVNPAHDFLDFENDFNVFSDIGNTYGLTTEMAHSGSKSMKIVTTTEKAKALMLGDSFYDSLPESGVSLWLYSESAFNFNNKNKDEILHYWDQGTWKQYTFPKSSIGVDDRDHYLILPFVGVTMYIDDICPADFFDGVKGTGFEDPYALNIAYTDTKNNFEITDELSYEGDYSLKVSTSGINKQVLIISDKLYDSLDDDGISFWIYTSMAFNGKDGSLQHELNFWDVDQWIQVTVSKENISDTEGNHCVFVAYVAVDVFIDNVMAI